MQYEFAAADVVRLLRRLEEELERREVCASVYIVGGAAIALEHDGDRRTVDVDARVVPESEVLEAAKAVADAEHIPPSWLNTPS